MYNSDESLMVMKALCDIMAFSSNEREEVGTDEDVLPQGYGEFGLEVTNPVPVHTLLGLRLYLERLRTKDGVKVAYERIGLMLAPNSPYGIEVYSIYLEKQEIAILYICPNNKKNSEKAPKGFQLASLSVRP